MRDELELESVEMVEELKEVEENIYFPSHYSPSGCPTVPIAFSGMTGRQLPSPSLTLHGINKISIPKHQDDQHQYQQHHQHHYQDI